MKKLKAVLSGVLAVALVSLTACEVNFGDRSVGDPFNSRLEEEYPSVSSEDSSALHSVVIESDGEESANESGVTSEETASEVGEEKPRIAPLSIHFLHLGNKTSGDCTLVKTGNVEVLIDAGSTSGSADTIVPYIQKYCTDGILEYVIATHGDSDHISSFVGEKGIFSNFECGVIIDFPKTTKTTQVYNNYVSMRDQEVAAGAKHYTALECWNNENGASRSYTLGEGVTMNILYQKYYETKTSTENNYSVCTLFTQGEKNYLFTGDLEKSGEESLVQSNDLPECEVYKAGHHGSNTSSTTTLLAEIKPKIVVANCCCGDKYDFPHQEFINNVSVYTDKVYIPGAAADNSAGYVLLNGNVVVSSDGESVGVNCSNNNTLFKDTDWFKANRTTPDAWE